MSAFVVVDVRRELERHRAGEWAALEALEVGDTSGAVEILLALVEDGGAERLPQLLCPDCGFDAVWPGVLEVHRLNVHREELPEEAGLRRLNSTLRRSAASTSETDPARVTGRKAAA